MLLDLLLEKWIETKSSQNGSLFRLYNSHCNVLVIITLIYKCLQPAQGQLFCVFCNVLWAQELGSCGVQCDSMTHVP